MKYAFYPGCVARGGAPELYDSALAVMSGSWVPSCRLGFACVGNRMAHALDEGPLSKALMSAMMSCF